MSMNQSTTRSSSTLKASSSSSQHAEPCLQNNQPEPELCCCRRKKIEAHISYGSNDDHITVAALPDDIQPRRAGKTFRDFLKAQEASHHMILQEMFSKLKEVNLEIEEKVQSIAELLCVHVQENRNDMDCVVKNCKDLEPIRASLKNSAVKEINQLAREREDDIQWLKREGMQLERERANKLRLVLREYFKRLVVLGKHQPHEVLQDFDGRIFEINQQLLSNIRAYTEMETQLQAQAKEDVTKAQSTINALASATMPLNSRIKSACHKNSDTGVSFKRRSNSMSSVERGLSTDTRADNQTLEEGEFDECVTRLVDNYKTALLKVFSGYQIKLEDLQNNLDRKQSVMFSDEKISETVELQQVIERVVRRLSTIVQNKIAQYANNQMFMDKARADVTAMQTSLYSLGEKLRQTYMLLHDAGHLWDAHIIRLALVQKLTLLAVEDLITSNDTDEMINETMTNIGLASVRTAPDVESAQAAYQEVKDMLDKTAKMYTAHSEAEIVRLEEFTHILPVMATTLMAEFRSFLSAHPLEHGMAAESTTHQLMTQSTSPRNSYVAYLPLPRAILQTELQALSLQNWRNGFLESLETAAAQIPEMLTEHERQWVEERAGMIQTRYTLKMISHSVRAERVKGLLDLRLAELRNHSERLKSHTEAVTQLIEGLHRLVISFEIHSPRLYPLNEKTKEYQDKIYELIADEHMDPETKRLKLLSYVPRLDNLLRFFLESVERVTDELKLEIEDHVQSARIANVRFLSKVTMFHEGGTYNATEASDTADALLEASNNIESSTNHVMDTLHANREILESTAENLITELQLHVKNHIALLQQILKQKGTK